MNTQKNYDIKDVAVYLRKSRGDEEKDLINHEILLTDMCEKYNWKYIKYKEIGTSDSIEMRPQMMKMLSDIKEGLFDAVLVVDDDRLSRGDMEDQAKIKQIFSLNNTYIITLNKIYDLANMEDEFMHDVNSLFSRREYKMINKRFQRGKKMGARRGNWTNGTPPFPYEYEKWKDKYNEKGIVVNDDKLPIYRFMIEQALGGTPPNNIAWELNKKHISSPRGANWTGVTINRILIDETHLGQIISNKGKGDSHAKRKKNAKVYIRNARSEWVVVENCHESVKTIAEHNKILEILNKRKLIPNRAKAGTYPFSNLIKCGICGHTMSFLTKEYANGSKYEFLKPCWYKDEFGNRCENKGIKLSRIEDDIFDRIIKYRNELLYKLKENQDDNDHLNSLTLNYNDICKSIEKYEDALERVNEAYELGDYTRNEWLNRKEKWDKKISDLEVELKSIQYKIDNQNFVTDEDKLKRVQKVLDGFNQIENSADKNDALKTIIDSIVFIRLSEDEMDIEVNFI